MYGGDFMELLNVKDFDEAIKEGYVCVVFSSKDCPPCEYLKNSLVKLNYPNVKLYEFHVAQLGAEPLTKKYHVSFVPRTIVFQDGKEVARFLLQHTVDDLQRFFQEIMSTGRFLFDPQDSEEICRFHMLVQDALDWDWKGMTQEKKTDKANEWIEIADDIRDKEPRWRLLSLEEVKPLLPA